MEKDNVLKKEFSKKDVTRLRNIVNKKFGDSVSTQVGYQKSYIKRSEGDIWEENGKQWTIKNGLKQNITKLDKVKNIVTPLFCPVCGNLMSNRLDKDYYRVHKKCFNCVIDFETQLRTKGLFEEYYNQLHSQGVDSFIENYKLWTKEVLEESKNSFITESGDVERWVGGNDSKINDEFNKAIEYLEVLKSKSFFDIYK